MDDIEKIIAFDTPQQFKEMGCDVLALTRSIPMAGTEIATIVAAGDHGCSQGKLIESSTDAAKW